MKLGELYEDCQGNEYVVLNTSGVGYIVADLETETQRCYYNPCEDHWLIRVRVDA